MQRNGRNSARLGARLRAVCGSFPNGLQRALAWLRVARRRASSENKSAKGPLSAYAQDLNRPLPVQLRHPLYISLAKGASVFEFTWVLRCCCVVCAAGGDAFSFGHGAVKIFTIFWDCVCAVERLSFDVLLLSRRTATVVR